MKRAIAKKNTSDRTKSKFSAIKRSQIYPTCTPKDVKRRITGFFFKKALHRGFKVYDLAGKDIYKICSCETLSVFTAKPAQGYP